MTKGRIAVYCVCDSIELKELQTMAKTVFPHGTYRHLPEVLYHSFADVSRCSRSSSKLTARHLDPIYFIQTVCCWHPCQGLPSRPPPHPHVLLL